MRETQREMWYSYVASQPSQQLGVCLSPIGEVWWSISVSMNPLKFDFCSDYKEIAKLEELEKLVYYLYTMWEEAHPELHTFRFLLYHLVYRWSAYGL